jgi:hypothetical protein
MRHDEAAVIYQPPARPLGMRALTLKPPWAAFVVAGMKRMETRSWRSDYRGPLAIHASKVGVTWGLGDLREDFYALDRLDPQGTWSTHGAVVAVACVSAYLRTEQLLGISDLERRLGNYSPGRWAWRLEEVRPLEDPVPCKGYQGLWTLPEDVEALVAEQLG